MAEVSDKQGLTEFWSACSTCSTQHHATVLSILSRIIQDNEIKINFLRFVSSDDPNVVDELSTLSLLLSSHL
jgi:hypothetical protein